MLSLFSLCIYHHLFFNYFRIRYTPSIYQYYPNAEINKNLISCKRCNFTWLICFSTKSRVSRFMFNFVWISHMDDYKAKEHPQNTACSMRVCDGVVATPPWYINAHTGIFYFIKERRSSGICDNHEFSKDNVWREEVCGGSRTRIVNQICL